MLFDDYESHLIAAHHAELEARSAIAGKLAADTKTRPGHVSGLRKIAECVGGRTVFVSVLGKADMTGGH